MLDLSNPDLDFVALANGLGVSSSRATTCDELAEQLATSFSTPGPTVIDCLFQPSGATT